MTNELDRFKVLEGKISRVLEHLGRLTAENEKLRQQVKDLKGEKKDAEETVKRMGKLDEDVKRYENERETIKGQIEGIIAQIDKLGL